MRVALYNLHFSTLGGGERRTAALAAHLARRHEVVLFVRKPVASELLSRLFGVDLSKVRMIHLDGCDEAAEIATFAPDLFINNSYGSELRCPSLLGIYMCMFPERHILPPVGYTVVTANSRFTASWIRRRWKVEPKVVYSPCQLMGPAAIKDKIILNVGRFFAPTPGNHHKRQDLLVHTFSQLQDLQDDGWEMHFAGNLGTLPEDLGFVQQLKASAVGYPIYFHLGLELNGLRALYRRATLYWHATGYGFEERLQPEKHEHFGMSIVEAMSAGAIPLAFAGGGPQETITHGRSGFLWHDQSELTRYTRQVLSEPSLWSKISTQALVDSQFYSSDRFFSRMDAVIDQLTTPEPSAVLR